MCFKWERSLAAREWENLAKNTRNEKHIKVHVCVCVYEELFIIFRTLQYM